MVRLPISPRSSGGGGSTTPSRYRSPSLPHTGHVRSIRSSWERSSSGAHNGNDNSAAVRTTMTSNDDGSVGLFKERLDERSNEYLRKWSALGGGAGSNGIHVSDQARGSHNGGGANNKPQSPRRRFVPNKDSPTWKSLVESRARGLLSPTGSSKKRSGGGLASPSKRGPSFFGGGSIRPKASDDGSASGAGGTQDTEEEEEDHESIASEVSGAPNGPSLDVTFKHSNSALKVEVGPRLRGAEDKKDDGSAGGDPLFAELKSRVPESPTLEYGAASAKAVASIDVDGEDGGDVGAGPPSSSGSDSSGTLNWGAIDDEHERVVFSVDGVEAAGGLAEAMASVAGSGQQPPARGGARGGNMRMTGVGGSGLYSHLNDDGGVRSCPSNDSTCSSSLIYSMGDTVKSSGSVAGMAEDSVKLSPSASEEDDEGSEDVLQETVRSAGQLLDGLAVVRGLSSDDEDDDDDEEEKEGTEHDGARENGRANNRQDDVRGKDAESDSDNDDDDDHNEDDDSAAAANLVASTLAECRLLLEMSPPPTPACSAAVGKRKPSLSVVTGEAEQEVSQKTQPVAVTDCAESKPKDFEGVKQRAREQPAPAIEDSLGPLLLMNAAHHHHSSHPSYHEEVCFSPTNASVANVSIASNSIAAYTLSSSITKFLTCPTCSKEFSEEDEASLPLHSFACDHIVCRGCVFSAAKASGDGEGSTAVRCPECGERAAFDTAHPVVSRPYLTLVKKMKSEVLSVVESVRSANATMSHGDGRSATVAAHGAQQQQQGQGQQPGAKTAVPSQICVPSPTAARGGAGALPGHRGLGFGAALSMAKEQEQTLHGENVSFVSSSSSSVASKKSQQSSSSSHRPASGVILAIEAAKSSDAEAEEEEEEHSSDVKIEEVPPPSAKNAATPPLLLMEPTTPVSRAEYRFQQRKVKLAQSLEKVNRILERSKANKTQSSSLSWSSPSRRSPYRTKMGLEDEHDGEEQLRDISAEKEEEENAQKPSDDSATLPEEILDQKTNIMRRLKKELRVDTGVQQASSKTSQPLQDASVPETAKTLEQEVNLTKQLDNYFQTKEAEGAYDEDPIMDIFRRPGNMKSNDAAPELIEFGANEWGGINQSVSNDSSLTDGRSDMMFLLAENRTAKARHSSGSAGEQSNTKWSSKVKKEFHIAGNNIMPLRQQQHQPQQKELRCPQFLPSLNYATMNDEDNSNELAGLVSDPFAAKSGGDLPPMSNKGSAKKVRHRISAGPTKFLKNLMSHSFDDSLFPRPVESYDCDDQENNGGAGNQTNPDDEAAHDEHQGPTYEFSMHSCSVSPSNNSYEDGQYVSNVNASSDVGGVGGGKSSLVTHKPKRLHKKILKTMFRGSGLKKKSKNSFA